MTANEAYSALIINNLDWYVIVKTDGTLELTHSGSLSSILECGQDPADYDIEEYHQCWNGEELDECPFEGFDHDEWMAEHEEDLVND